MPLMKMVMEYQKKKNPGDWKKREKEEDKREKKRKDLLSMFKRS